MSQKRTLGILPSLLVVVLILLMAGALGCGGSQETTTTSAATVTTDTGPSSTDTTATTAAPGGFKFGRSNPVASNQALISVVYGAEQMAELLGDSWASLDANLSFDKQVADIDTLISMKVDGLVSWTLDPGAAGAAYKRAQAAGIPVVTESSPGEGMNTIFINENFLTSKSQEDAARYIAERIPGAKILVVGGIVSPYMAYVTNNMIAAAKKAGLVVLEHQDNMKDNAAGSQPLVQDMLTKYPDVQAIWAYNDPSALGASAAVRAAGMDIWQEGKTKGVIIIGMNGSPEAIDAIKAGVQTVTYDSQFEVIGGAETELLHRVASGQMKIADMPKVIFIPTARYDFSNVTEYVNPLERKIEVGMLDPLIEGTDPTVLDDYLKFLAK